MDPHAYLLYGMQAIVANQIQHSSNSAASKAGRVQVWTQYCGRCSWLGAVARASGGSVMSASVLMFTPEGCEPAPAPS